MTGLSVSPALRLQRGASSPSTNPKVRMSDGKRQSFEALARIVLPDKTVLGPDKFTLALQDREMGRRIGIRMLRAVTSDLAAWRTAGLEPGSVSLNVGEIDFADGKLATRVLARLDELALPRSALTIEVTELVFLGDDAGQVREALAQLDAEEFASNSMISAPDTPRCGICGNFRSAGSRSTSDSSPILEPMRTAARSCAQSSASATISTVKSSPKEWKPKARLPFLKEMGCDAAQGYLYGKAASARGTRALLRERGRCTARITPHHRSGALCPSFRSARCQDVGRAVRASLRVTPPASHF